MPTRADGRRVSAEAQLTKLSVNGAVGLQRFAAPLKVKHDASCTQAPRALLKHRACAPSGSQTHARLPRRSMEREE